MVVSVYEPFLVNVEVSVHEVSVAVLVLVLEMLMVVRRVRMDMCTMPVDVLVHMGLMVRMVVAVGRCSRARCHVCAPARLPVERDRAPGAQPDDREVAEARLVADRRADLGTRRVEPRGVDGGHSVAAFARDVLRIA